MYIPLSPNFPFTLVGREAELGVLREHLKAALTEQGNLIFIDGEAGSTAMSFVSSSAIRTPS
jgi:hypothetical protein